MGIMKSLVGSMSVSLTVLSTFVFADSVVREPWRTAGNAVTRTGGLWGTGDALDVETPQSNTILTIALILLVGFNACTWPGKGSRCIRLY